VGLPSPNFLRLSEAVSFLVSRASCSDDDAKEALRRAGVEGRLRAEGSIPLSAHRDPRKREEHPARKRQMLGPEDWDGQIDWSAGRIGPYSFVFISKASIEAWLSSAVPPNDERTLLRDAPDGEIKRAIKTVYENAKTAGKKPPNIKELASEVQPILKSAGYRTSNHRIQQLGDEFKDERRRPGKTLRSERDTE